MNFAVKIGLWKNFAPTRDRTHDLSTTNVAPKQSELYDMSLMERNNIILLDGEKQLEIVFIEGKQVSFAKI